MDEVTRRAFEKMQKREHFLRTARNQMALGRISREVFRQRETNIIERFALTHDEQRAYDLYCKIQSQRRSK